MKRDEYMVKRILVALVVVIICITVFTLGHRVFSGGDSINIISITPNTIEQYGNQITFQVSVSYMLVSKEQGILYLGFNTFKADTYHLVDDHRVVEKGSGTYTFTASVSPKKWNAASPLNGMTGAMALMDNIFNGTPIEESDFKAYVNLSVYPHTDSWNPLAIDVVTINGAPSLSFQPVPDNEASIEKPSQLIVNAQKLYDDLVDPYNNVEDYLSVAIIAAFYDYKAILNAIPYTFTHKSVIDYSSTAVNVAIAGLIGNFNESVKSIASESLSIFIDNLTPDVTGMPLDEFVYLQSTAGYNQIGFSDFMQVAFSIEDNGGRIRDEATAVEFIKVFQNMQAGWRTVIMGRRYFEDKLNQSPVKAVSDIIKSVGASQFIAKLIGGNLGNIYEVEFMVEKVLKDEFVDKYFYALIEFVNNKHITEWYNDIVQLTEETIILLNER